MAVPAETAHAVAPGSGEKAGDDVLRVEKAGRRGREGAVEAEKKGRGPSRPAAGKRWAGRTTGRPPPPLPAP